MKERAAKKPKTSRATWIVLAVIFSLILLALLWHPPSRDIPDMLLGEWHTSDPNYADRSFEITPVSISFTTGGGTVSTGVIKEFRSAPDGNRTLYTVVYDVDGTRNEVSFYYEMATPDGPRSPSIAVIRLKNQQNTMWTRIENS